MDRNLRAGTPLWLKILLLKPFFRFLILFAASFASHEGKIKAFNANSASQNIIYECTINFENENSYLGPINQNPVAVNNP